MRFLRRRRQTSEVKQSGPITVLIASDDGAWRTALRQALAGHAWAEVVGESAELGGAIDLALKKVPDVVVMEMRAPSSDAAFATRIILEDLPSVRVLIVRGPSGERNDHLLAKEAGALGYTRKGESMEQLAEDIHTVSRGEQIGRASLVGVFAEGDWQIFEPAEEPLGASDVSREGHLRSNWRTAFPRRRALPSWSLPSYST